MQSNLHAGFIKPTYAKFRFNLVHGACAHGPWSQGDGAMHQECELHQAGDIWLFENQRVNCAVVVCPHCCGKGKRALRKIGWAGMDRAWPYPATPFHLDELDEPSRFGVIANERFLRPRALWARGGLDDVGVCVGGVNGVFAPGPEREPPCVEACYLFGGLYR
jgi:hypothetical protein